MEIDSISNYLSSLIVQNTQQNSQSNSQSEDIQEDKDTYVSTILCDDEDLPSQNYNNIVVNSSNNESNDVKMDKQGESEEEDQTQTELVVKPDGSIYLKTTTVSDGETSVTLKKLSSGNGNLEELINQIGKSVIENK